MIISGYVLKAAIAFLDTPLFYLAVWFFRTKLPPVPDGVASAGETASS